MAIDLKIRFTRSAYKASMECLSHGEFPDEIKILGIILLEIKIHCRKQRHNAILKKERRVLLRFNIVAAMAWRKEIRQENLEKHQLSPI